MPHDHAALRAPSLTVAGSPNLPPRNLFEVETDQLTWPLAHLSTGADLFAPLIKIGVTTLGHLLMFSNAELADQAARLGLFPGLNGTIGGFLADNHWMLLPDHKRASPNFPSEITWLTLDYRRDENRLVVPTQLLDLVSLHWLAANCGEEASVGILRAAGYSTIGDVSSLSQRTFMQLPWHLHASSILAPPGRTPSTHAQRTMTALLLRIGYIWPISDP